MTANQKDINEEIYISALKGGSYEAFTVIYNRYVDMIYSFCISQTKNKTVSQDIVQCTFMKLWDKRHSLDCNKNIQAFLFTIARHQIIDNFRKQIIKVEFEDYLNFCEQQPESTSVEDKIYYDEFLVRLKKSKSKLSHRECEIFEMSRKQNMPINQIAEALQLSPQTVKNHITASLKIFRKNLLEKKI